MSNQHSDKITLGTSLYSLSFSCLSKERNPENVLYWGYRKHYSITASAPTRTVKPFREQKGLNDMYIRWHGNGAVQIIKNPIYPGLFSLLLSHKCFCCLIAKSHLSLLWPVFRSILRWHYFVMFLFFIVTTLLHTLQFCNFSFCTFDYY